MFPDGLCGGRCVGRPADRSPAPQATRSWPTAWALVVFAALASLASLAVGQAPTDAQSADLRATARERGAIRVIVELDVDVRPEGLATAAAVAAQRRAIGAVQDAVLRALPDAARVVERRYVTAPLLALTVNEAALVALDRDPRVARVREDLLLRPVLGESVPLVGAPTAWSAGDGEGVDGTGWAVAVLDTGVDGDHPMLAGKTVAEACFSSDGGAEETFSVCPNARETQIGPGASTPPLFSGFDHGTHVAGIAVGASDDLTGVARGADLIAVQVFSLLVSPSRCDPDPSPCVRSFTSDYFAGLEHVYGLRDELDIASVNLSLSGGLSSGTCGSNAIVDNLTSAGIAVVAASGNDSSSDGVGHPACLANVVAVGATGDGSGRTPVDTVPTFSNSSDRLDLLAPGEAIVSAVPGAAYVSSRGTSMAAPHVAGAWALVRQADPAMDVGAALAAFRDHGVPITDPRNDVTRARLDLGFLGPGDPNLAFLPGVTIEPPNPRAGDPVDLCYGWTNEGDGPASTRDGAPGFYAVRIYLDADLATDAEVAEWSMAAGLPSGFEHRVCDRIADAVEAGPHTAYLHLDPDDRVDESDEADNATDVAFDVAWPGPGPDARIAPTTSTCGSVGTDQTCSVDIELSDADGAWQGAEFTLDSDVLSLEAVATGGIASGCLATVDGDAVAIACEATFEGGGLLAEATFRRSEPGDARVATNGAALIRADGGRAEVSGGELVVATTACETASYVQRPLGDVDASGTVTTGDALIVLRTAAGSRPVPEAGSYAAYHADLDGDGELTTADALLLLRKAVDPERPPSLAVGPLSADLAQGESLCVLIGNNGRGELPVPTLDPSEGVTVADVSPDGAAGRAYLFTLTSAASGSVDIDAGPAGRATVRID